MSRRRSRRYSRRADYKIDWKSRRADHWVVCSTWSSIIPGGACAYAWSEPIQDMQIQHLHLSVTLACVLYEGIKWRDARAQVGDMLKASSTRKPPRVGVSEGVFWTPVVNIDAPKEILAHSRPASLTAAYRRTFWPIWHSQRTIQDFRRRITLRHISMIP